MNCAETRVLVPSGSIGFTRRCFAAFSLTDLANALHAKSAAGRIDLWPWVSSFLRGHQKFRSRPSQEVVHEFSHGHDASNKKMIAGAGAGDIEKMPFSMVNLLEVSIVGH